MNPQPRHSTRTGALLVCAAVLLANCGGGSNGDGGSTAVSTAPWALHATTDAAFTAYVREALGPGSSGSMLVTTAGGVPAPTAPDVSGAAASFSDTTLQETGVDEADLIKSDGVSVFSLDAPTTGGFPRNALRRQRLAAAAGDAALTPVDSLALPFSSGVTGAGIYLDSERQQVVALGQWGYAAGVYQMWFAPQAWSQGATELALVSAAPAAAMQVTRKLRFSANLIGSRRLGPTLYLVLRSYPSLPGLDPSWQPANAAANRALLDALQPQQVLPTVSIDGAAPQPLVDAASCLMQDQTAAKTADIITIVGIDLATGARAARCFAGPTEAFYMSSRNLYLATTRYTYGTGGATPVYAAQTSTDIHKFALDALAITYRGSGNVKGHLGFDQNRKSFRLGEYQDALRVVTQTQTQSPGIMSLPPVPGGAGTTTTTGTATTTANLESPAQLTILQEQGGAMATVGELPNATRPEPLGKAGEQLYASRFIGSRGYIVTYRLIDPLYVLDLSNPADPRVTGQLQVSGYSDYLFPVSDTMLLGVGKDAIGDGSAGDGRLAWYQGVKVSLIDVSDPAHPTEAARQVIGRRGTSATVLSDHHGIAIQSTATGARIALPVSLHDTPPSVPTGNPNEYYQFTRTELQRFEIDVPGKRLAQLPALPGNVSGSGERSIANDRSLLWQNQVHWYQDGFWRAAQW
jgi:hypothetical protein